MKPRGDSIPQTATETEKSMTLRPGMKIRLVAYSDRLERRGSRPGVNSDMVQYFGSVLTVDRVVDEYDGYFKVKEDGSGWTWWTGWIDRDYIPQPVPAGMVECRKCGEFYAEKIDTPARLMVFKDRHICPDCGMDMIDTVWEYHDRAFGIIDRGDKRRKATLHFGAEIECDGFDYEDEAEEAGRAALVELTDAIPWAYLEHDGSLDAGVELITQPHAIDDPDIYTNIDRYVWEMERRGAYLGKSTTGLHIHLDRRYYGELSDTIGLVANYICCALWDKGLSDLCRRSSIFSGSTNPEKNDCLRYHKDNRYNCVNLKNRDTVEFRIFGGARSGLDVKMAVTLSRVIMKVAKKALSRGCGLKPGEYLHAGITDPVDGLTIKTLYSSMTDTEKATFTAYIKTLPYAAAMRLESEVM